MVLSHWLKAGLIRIDGETSVSVKDDTDGSGFSRNTIVLGLLIISTLVLVAVVIIRLIMARFNFVSN